MDQTCLEAPGQSKLEYIRTLIGYGEIALVNGQYSRGDAYYKPYFISVNYTKLSMSSYILSPQTCCLAALSRAQGLKAYIPYVSGLSIWAFWLKGLRILGCRV